MITEYVKIRTATVHQRIVGEENTLCGKWSGTFKAISPWPGLDDCKQCKRIKEARKEDIK